MARRQLVRALFAMVLAVACTACASAGGASSDAGSPSDEGGLQTTSGATNGPASVPGRCAPGAPVDQAVPTPSDSKPGAVELPGGPVGLLAAAGGVWVAVAPADQVARLDPGSGTVTGTVAVGETPLRLAVAGGGIWVSEFGNGSIARFDPATRRVTCRVAVGDQPEGLATDGWTLWVVLEASNKLVEVDAGTGVVRRSIALPDGGQPRLALYDRGIVWVADYQGSRLVPVAAGTGAVGTPVRGCTEPQGLAVAADRLWVACLGTQEVVAVRTVGVPAVITRVKVPGDPDGVDADGGRIYVALSNGPGVCSLDAATAALGPVVPLGSSGPLRDADVDVLVAGGQVWVTSFNEHQVYRRGAAPVG